MCVVRTLRRNAAVRALRNAAECITLALGAVVRRCSPLFAAVLASFTPDSKRYASLRPIVSLFGLFIVRAASEPRQAGQEVT